MVLYNTQPLLPPLKLFRQIFQFLGLKFMLLCYPIKLHFRLFISTHQGLLVILGPLEEPGLPGHKAPSVQLGQPAPLAPQALQEPPAHKDL